MNWFIGMLIVLIDQVSKNLISRYIPLESPIPLIPGLLTLFHVRNPGVAFGFLPYKQGLVILFTIIFLLALIAVKKKIAKESSLVRWGVTLAVAGAIGNLIDRVRLGYVLDFVSVPLIPIFNVADMSIVFGVGLIIIDIIFGRSRQPLKSAEQWAKAEGNGENN